MRLSEGTGTMLSFHFQSISTSLLQYLFHLTRAFSAHQRDRVTVPRPNVEHRIRQEPPTSTWLNSPFSFDATVPFPTHLFFTSDGVIFWQLLFVSATCFFFFFFFMFFFIFIVFLILFPFAYIYVYDSIPFL